MLGGGSTARLQSVKVAAVARQGKAFSPAAASLCVYSTQQLQQVSHDQWPNVDHRLHVFLKALMTPMLQTKQNKAEQGLHPCCSQSLFIAATKSASGFIRLRLFFKYHRPIGECQGCCEQGKEGLVSKSLQSKSLQS